MHDEYSYTHFSHTTSPLPYYGLCLSGGLSATPEREWVITGDRSVRWWRVLLSLPPGVATMYDLGVSAGEMIWPGTG